MSLTQALWSSASGLRVTQAGLSLVAANVANADTAGYVRKTLVQETTRGGEGGAGVAVAGVDRELDRYVQRQLRIETSGGAYADLRAQFHDRLQQLYGSPGADSALETRFNDLTSALQALGTSPTSAAARADVLDKAQALAGQLNDITAGLQGLRTEADSRIADSVASANAAMRQIAELNQRLAASPANDAAAAALKDQRDRALDQLSTMLDIRVVESGDQVSVFTGSGLQLVGSQAATLDFKPSPTITAAQQWSADSARSNLGTITLRSPNGDAVDLLANRGIRSGAIAAAVEMRDQVLVGAQDQLDALAAAMSQALSDRTEPGTAVNSGIGNGFDLDLTGLLAGNSLQVADTDAATGAQRSVRFVRVDDPNALPLPTASGTDANSRVVGVNFSAGPASVASQIAAALGTGFSVSSLSASGLRILDDGGATVTLNAAATTKTVASLADGGTELPFFTDGRAAFTGAITSSGGQQTGFAGRIAVNPALTADPGRLVAYRDSPPTAAGDTARATFIADKLASATLAFSVAGARGAQSTRSTLPSFLRQVISMQAQAAANADSLKQGQQVVVNALQQRFNDASGVNIDQEMTNLLQLQSSYSANARVLSAVRDMLDLLMRM